MHATGIDEDYVKCAIAEGVSVLGFSDHAPMPYGDGYVSYYKMTPGELPTYTSSILTLREKYADKIETEKNHYETCDDVHRNSVFCQKASKRSRESAERHEYKREAKYEAQ